MKDSQCACTALQALQTAALSGPRGISGSSSMFLIIVPDEGSSSLLSMLLQDICNSVIQLRDPLYDLEDLIHGGVCAYRCSMYLSIEWNWWVEWLDRMLCGDVSAPLPSADNGTIINLNNQPLTYLATGQLFQVPAPLENSPPSPATSPSARCMYSTLSPSWHVVSPTASPVFWQQSMTADTSNCQPSRTHQPHMLMHSPHCER
ncbi:hypothetical protein EV702DRAFT_1063390, partial [Suillus placidus]